MSRWTNLALRTKGFIIGTALAAVLAVAAAFVYGAADGASDAERAMDRVLGMREQIQRLSASETNALSEASAYWITRDEAFSSGVREELAEFDSSMRTLAQLTAGNPRQHERLSQLAALERSRLERLFATLAKFRSGRMTNDELSHTVLAGQDERVRMGELIGAMDQEEKRELDMRVARLEYLRGVMKISMWVGFVVAIGSGLAIWLLFANGIKHRIQRLKENMAKLGAGQVVDASMPDQLNAVCESLVRTAESLQRQNLVLENAFYGIAQVDFSGRYLSFNRAYGRLAGLSKQGPFPEVLAGLHADDRKKLEEALEQMSSNGRGETEARMLRSDGSVIEVVLSVSPIGATAEEGYYIFLRDNSLQKNAETALVRAKDAAVASNVAKTSFLAKIGHEIRTPLNAILGTAELLSETELNAQQAEFVSIFRRNSGRLVALINDFLDFSKIEAGAVRVDRVPFKIRQAVYDVVETFREPAARKGLGLDALVDPGVPECQMGDGHRLQQVLTNLVSNAIKFTSAGRVEVRVGVVALPAPSRLRFEVADTGPGIRAADREYIFSPFTQVKDAGAPLQGTGLGLTICRELVQLMGGSVGLTSDESRGSTFYFEIPLDAVASAGEAFPEPKPVARALTPSSSQPLRLLVAEDVADSRLLLQAYLKDQPVTLQFAENGQEVIDSLKRGDAFDLILMDLDMPVVDGLSAARWVRGWQSRGALPATPIVALSAHAIHEAVRASLDAGCVAHVAKPVDRRTLMDTITRYARPAFSSDRVDVRLQSLPQEVAALVPNYLVSQAKQIETARTQLDRHDFDSIRRFGHNLKGTGRGYGFPEIEKMGSELERAAKESGERSVSETLEALHRFVHSASDQIDDSARVA